MIDFKLAASIGLGYIKNWLPGGIQRGSEWVALNPRRPSDTRRGSFSVNLDTGVWSDFAESSASGGDAVSLYAYLNNIPQADAAKEILDKYGNRGAAVVQTTQRPQETTRKYQTIYPAPDDAGTPSMHHNSFGDPTMVWTYRDANGKTIFHIARYDQPGQRKQFTPWSYTTEGWRTIGHTDPRPLYNLDLLAKYPDKPVLIVEGEKCASAGAAILTGYVVTCWPNGTSSVGKVDWSPLKGRSVYLWPDNDETGLKAARDIKAELLKFDTECNVLDIPEGKPKGWDIYDAIQIDGMLLDELLAFVGWKQEPEESPEKFDQFNLPYTPLGYDHDFYYFHTHMTHEVKVMGEASFGRKASLFALAPLDYWEVEYPSKSGINLDLVSNTLIQQSHQAGNFDVSRIRGRGAWYDDGRVVLHLGDRLIVDGVTTPVNKIRSYYIYEGKLRIGNVDAVPLSKEEACEVLRILNLVYFNKSASHVLLAGWCVLSTICGALDWRPHIWVTGPAGSGKSWIMENIVMPMLGKMNVHALGKSTEAGIRQTLNGDALPVVIDEAEIDDRGQKDTMQSILTLMRQSSSDSTAGIIKGSSGGKSHQVFIRSCFMLSSIGIGTKYHADETRTTNIEIKKDTAEGSAQRFEYLQGLVSKILTREFCDGLQARAIKMIPIIRKNKRVLKSYIQKNIIDSSRMSDQYGTLLAGAYALISDDIITPEEAKEFVKVLVNREDDTQTTDVSDHGDCLQAILQTKTQVRSTSNGSIVDTSFGELLAVISNNAPNIGISESDMDRHLRSHGMKYTPYSNTVHFAVNHNAIKIILRNTPWADNYSNMLRRIKDATVDEKTTYITGSRMRGTAIPADVIFSEDSVDV